MWSPVLPPDTDMVITRSLRWSFAALTQIEASFGRPRDEEFPDPGTRVRIWLHDPPTYKKKLLPQSGNYPWFWAKLERLFGGSLQRHDPEPLNHLCWNARANSPNDRRERGCELEFSDTTSDRADVIQARDWLTIPFAKLQERTGEHFGNGSDILSDTDKIILVDGEPAARLAVSTAYNPTAHLTIGGFATQVAATGFAGVLIGGSPTLTRYSGHPTINEQAFRDWLASIESSLGRARMGIEPAMGLVNFYLRYGLRLRNVPCIYFRNSVFSFDQLVSAKLPDQVTIVVTDEFVWGLPNGDTNDVSFGKAIQENNLELEAAVIIASAVDLETLRENRIAWPGAKNATVRESLSTRSSILPSKLPTGGEFLPTSLPLLALEAVAANWGLDFGAFIAASLSKPKYAFLFEDYDVVIGTYLGDPVDVHALIMRKPPRPAKTR